MRVTKASLALRKRFETRGRQRDCAAETGIGQSRLSRIADGELFPRADEGAALQRSDGILIDWWETKLEDSRESAGAV